MLLSLLISAALAQPIKKPTQADRIEERLIRVESLIVSSTKREARRVGEIRKYNRCNESCASDFPWDDLISNDPVWQSTRNTCYAKCKLPDDILGAE